MDAAVTLLPQDTVLVSLGKEVQIETNWLACRANEATVVLRQSELDAVYYRLVENSVKPVFNKVITNLLKQKEYLALQLDLALGNIDEKDFDKREPFYLTEPRPASPAELKKDVNILYALSGVPLDALEISDVLGCSIDDAEKAIQSLLFKEQSDAGL